MIINKQIISIASTVSVIPLKKRILGRSPSRFKVLLCFSFASLFPSVVSQGESYHICQRCDFHCSCVMQPRPTVGRLCTISSSRVLPSNGTGRTLMTVACTKLHCDYNSPESTVALLGHECHRRVLQLSSLSNLLCFSS